MKRGIKNSPFLVGLIAAVFGIANKAEAQTTLPVSRTAWDAGAPTGWTDSGTSAYTSTFACTGSNMGQLNTTGDFYTVWFTGTPGTLTYSLKGSSFSGGTFLVEESADNSTWSTLATYTTLGGCANFSNALTATTRYVRFNYSIKSLGNVGLDDVQIAVSSSCTPAAEPTTHASSLIFSDLQCTSLTLNWTNGNGAKRMVVAKNGSAVTGTPADQNGYNANSTFGSGSAIAANEYVVYNGTGSTVTVTGLTMGSNYYFKIFEYNGSTADCQENYLTSGTPLNGNRVTNSCTQNPYLTGVLINSCNGSCDEGQNEMFFLYSGSYSIPVSAANVIVKYDNATPPTTTYTDGFTANATYINTLNTTANCGTLFYDALTEGTIPANTRFIIMHQNPCYSYDFTSFCNAGPIYMLFSTDASWLVGGNFANTGAGTRYFRTDFTAVTGSSSVIDYSYEPSLLTNNADGDGISYSPTGGAPSNYFNSGSCTPPVTILPIELLYFNAYKKDSEVELRWATSSEINNDYFTVERTINGEVADVVAENIKGAGNSNIPLYYIAYDKKPLTETAYYRLKQIDFDGKFSYSEWVAVKIAAVKDKTVVSWRDGKLLIMSEYNGPLNFEIFDVSGRLVHKGEVASVNESSPIEIPYLPAGIYFVKSFGEMVIVNKIVIL